MSEEHGSPSDIEDGMATAEVDTNLTAMMNALHTQQVCDLPDALLETGQMKLSEEATQVVLDAAREALTECMSQMSHETQLDVLGRITELIDASKAGIDFELNKIQPGVAMAASNVISIVRKVRDLQQTQSRLEILFSMLFTNCAQQAKVARETEFTEQQRRILHKTSNAELP